MASSSGFAAVLRQWRASRSSVLLSRTQRHAFPFTLGESPIRLFSLSTSDNGLDEDQASQHGGDLRSRIFRLRFPKRSATAALDRWAEEGRKVTAPELRDITRELRRAQRYKHALEICEWMIAHHKSDITDSDYVARIDLITKVFGASAAEEFFEGIPDNAKTPATYTALLHCLAGAKQIDKAESLFKRMKKLDINFPALTYNEMMTLYISMGQHDKVCTVIEELKRSEVPPDLFSYNLWISASAAVGDTASVREILDEMHLNMNSNDGWKIYIVLAEIYMNNGCLEGIKNSLVESNRRTSQSEWITYDFLIILQAGLGNKERIGEIWKSLLLTSQKMTSRNYLCVISSYLVLGLFKEAGEIIDQWKQSNSSEVDASACGRLFATLVNAGLTSEADSFQQMMLEQNCEMTKYTQESE